jgi:hypothetical protein
MIGRRGPTRAVGIASIVPPFRLSRRFDHPVASTIPGRKGAAIAAALQRGKENGRIW